PISRIWASLAYMAYVAEPSSSSEIAQLERRGKRANSGRYPEPNVPSPCGGSNIPNSRAGKCETACGFYGNNNQDLWFYRAMRSLNLDQLRAFVAVIERGSFTAAAHELNLK